MIKKSLVSIMIAALAILAGGCQKSTESNANANANAGETAATTTTTGPDNSEITTTTDANGVKTQTRVFRGNSRVSKVVVTTRDGNRTVRVYSASGEERELKSDTEKALEATGDAIADAAGWVKDKAVDVADKTKEGAKTVADKTVDTSKTVARRTTAGAKTVANKTTNAAKKTGNRIKKIVTP